MEYVKAKNTQSDGFDTEGWLLRTAEDLQLFCEKQLLPAKRHLEATYKTCGERPDRWGHLAFGNTLEQALHSCFIPLMPHEEEFSLSVELAKVVLKYIKTLTNLLQTSEQGVLVNHRFGLNPIDDSYTLVEANPNRARSISRCLGEYVILENDQTVPDGVFSYIAELPRGSRKGFVVLNNIRETYGYFEDQRELREIFSVLSQRGFKSLLFMSSGTDLYQLRLFFSLWLDAGGRSVTILKGEGFGAKAEQVLVEFPEIKFTLI